MADNYSTLKLEDVQHLTDILAPDILESSALLNSDIFADLYIKVLTGIEYKQSQLIFHRKGSTSRPYVPGSTIESKLGYMEERKLEVQLAWNRYFDNIQNYREKEPWSIQGANGTYSAPNSEFAIRNIGTSFSEDIMSNLVFGKKSLGKDSPLALFDGYDTHLSREIQLGKITPITIDPFVDAVSESSENFDNFSVFVSKLSPNLKRKPLVVVYCSDRVRMLIIDGYLKRYVGLQTPDAAKKEFRFLGMPNIELVAHPILGEGDRLIATVPFNFEYGVDTLNDWSRVSVDKAQEDFNVLIYQIQSAQGVRISRITPDYLAVSNGSSKAIEGLNGDYQHDTLTLIANSTMGTVAANPEKPSYVEGENIVLTATPKTGYKFTKWHDNLTVNPRTIIYSGYPETYEAAFEEDPEKTTDPEGSGTV